MADSAGSARTFFFILIRPLISLYRIMFSAVSSTLDSSSSSFSSSTVSLWTNRLFALFTFLCIKPDQITDILRRFAAFVFAPTDLTYTPTFTPRQTFITVPNVLLQVTIPSSGFTVTCRALLDSGAEFSSLSSRLATLLTANGATCQYIWPCKINWTFWKRSAMLYRKIDKLTVRSVEDQSVTMTTSITVDDFPQLYTSLPVDLVAEKMASLGLPMIQSAGKLGRTMWSEEEPHSQYRIDMVIGQDLLNAHFNMTPLQPTYHITPSLAIIRTKMGLAFIGKFDIEKFKQWTLCAVDAEKMKKALCPESKSDLLNDIEMSPAKMEELNKMLTVNISDIKRSWCEYIYFLASVIIYSNVFIYLLAVCFLVFILKYLLLVSTAHRLSIISSAHTLLLAHFFAAAFSFGNLFAASIVPIIKQKWFSIRSSGRGNTIGPDSMPYNIRPQLALIVKSDACTKTVMADIDTGTPYSKMSTQLASELKVGPEVFKEYASRQKREVVKVQLGKVTTTAAAAATGNISVQPLFAEAQFEITSTAFSSKVMSIPLMKEVATLLNVPMPDQSCCCSATTQLLIGADLIPSLLMPSPSLPTRHIALASNLHAVKTRLGYYLQEAQIISGYDRKVCLVYSWSPRSLTANLSMVICLFADTIVVCILDLIVFKLYKIFF